MEVLKAIRTLIVSDDDLFDRVGTRVYSYIAEQGAAAPYVVCDVISVVPSDCKNHPSNLDEYIIQIDTYSKTASDTAIIDRKIRELIDRTISGTVEGISIQGIRYSNSIMQFDEERELRGISSDYDVRVVRDAEYDDDPRAWGLGTYDSDTEALADGVNCGGLYYLSAGNIYGMAEGLIKKVTEC